MDGIAHVEDAQVCRVDLTVRAVGEPCRRQGPQDSHVAQSTAGLLEVRLDEVRAVPPVSYTHLDVYKRQLRAG